MSRFSGQVHSAATEDEEDGEDERVGSRMLIRLRGGKGRTRNTLKVMRKTLNLLDHIYENKTITYVPTTSVAYTRVDQERGGRIALAQHCARPLSHGVPCPTA